MGISQSAIDELLGKGAHPSDTGLHPEVASSAPAHPAEVTPDLPAPPSKPVISVPAPQSNREGPAMQRILGLSVPVSVTLAERYLDIETILATKVGTIIEFGVPFDSELTLNVAGHPIGTGQAVKIGENFGLRVNQIAGVRDRIEAMRG